MIGESATFGSDALEAGLRFVSDACHDERSAVNGVLFKIIEEGIGSICTELG